MKPSVVKNLRKIVKFSLLNLILTVYLTTNSLPALAQSDGNSMLSEDNSFWYVLAGVIGIVLIAVIALRFRKKSEVSDENNADAANSIKKTGYQSKSNNISRQSESDSTPLNSKIKAINYDEDFEGLGTNALRIQNYDDVNGSQNASDLNENISWELRPPTTFENLPESESDAVFDALEQLSADDGDATMRSLAIRVLSASQTIQSVEGLSRIALRADSAKHRIEALTALGAFDHESVFEPILLACADSSREVRAAAARMLTRLTFDRSDAFVRIIESDDAERLTLASRACIESGFASRAFERLSARDAKQSYEAFTILTLLAKSDETKPFIETIAKHPNLQVRLATIKTLHSLDPQKMAPALYEISTEVGVPPEIKTALGELLYHLSTSV